MSTPNGSGASEQNASGGANGGNEPTKTVNFEDHKRALDDMHKFKSESLTLKEQVDAQARELAELKRKGAEGSGDFKSLYETERQAKADLENKYNELKGSVQYNEKFKAANSALVKAGLKPEALKILEKEGLDEIKLEVTNTGRFIPHGVDQFVDRFKREFPFAFAAPNTPNFNGGGGGGTPPGGGEDVELTPSEMFRLEKTDPKKYKEMLPKYLAQRRAKQK